MKLIKTRCIVSAALLLASSLISQAATVGTDGGITLYISCDNLDLPGGISWSNTITQTNTTTQTDVKVGTKGSLKVIVDNVYFDEKFLCASLVKALVSIGFVQKEPLNYFSLMFI